MASGVTILCQYLYLKTTFNPDNGGKSLTSSLRHAPQASATKEALANALRSQAMRLKEDAAKKAQDARELEEEVCWLPPRPCIAVADSTLVSYF